MAAAGLLALMDDIATLLDDVAVLSKVAAKKTAGVLGDDLALNAEQASGVRAERELPVVWAVAKGSLKNKVLLVPGALLISAFIPWLITPLLMIGGLYLCFEGVEKVLHYFLHRNEESSEHADKLNAVADPSIDMVAFEKDKISGAIRTDFILSAEIIVIALGTVKDAPFLTQALVVSAIALVVTVGVYSLVAGIVKMDDAGLYLIKNSGNNKAKYALGKTLLLTAPRLMKLLTVFGTIAMFLVGGGILVHALPFLHDAMHSVNHFLAHANMAKILESILAAVSEPLFSGLVGALAGSIVLSGVTIWGKIRNKGEVSESGV